eukprot:TRINITY_DN10581_c0_g1_i11.p2 TRINITY_DN10581_c0_g1~~TRINITY_DN10581_c0_g1_i11.p2  ORF type:complete len:156 (+),score=49.99 TRINITY_DN10581_c0_g1_i11:231-698(+)
MAHLLTLMTYGAFTLITSLFNIMMVDRLSERLGSAHFWLEYVSEWATVAVFLIGLMLGTWSFLGLEEGGKRTIIIVYYGVVIVLGLVTAAVIWSMMEFIQVNPKEFIDNTGLFQMVYCGYKIAKWGMSLSFTVCLNELFTKDYICLLYTSPSPRD